MKHTARFFKAIADQRRLQILWLLFRTGQATVREIEDTLGIPQSKAIPHLKYLVNAGVVTNRDGVPPVYRVMPQTDTFRRATLEGLKSKLSEPGVWSYMEKKLKERAPSSGA